MISICRHAGFVPGMGAKFTSLLTVHFIHEQSVHLTCKGVTCSCVIFAKRFLARFLLTAILLVCLSCSQKGCSQSVPKVPPHASAITRSSQTSHTHAVRTFSSVSYSSVLPTVHTYIQPDMCQDPNHIFLWVQMLTEMRKLHHSFPLQPMEFISTLHIRLNFTLYPDTISRKMPKIVSESKIRIPDPQWI